MTFVLESVFLIIFGKKKRMIVFFFIVADLKPSKFRLPLIVFDEESSRDLIEMSKYLTLAFFLIRPERKRNFTVITPDYRKRIALK